jgi:hypothetical protein
MSAFFFAPGIFSVFGVTSGAGPTVIGSDPMQFVIFVTPPYLNGITSKMKAILQSSERQEYVIYAMVVGA